jgi:Protein of unknown function (DUF3489)
MTKKTKAKQTRKAQTHQEPDTAASVAEPVATVTSSAASSKPGTSQKKDAAQGRKKAKSKEATTPASSPTRQSRRKGAPPAAAKNPPAPKPDSKGEQMLTLLRREQGASLAELRQATGWQAHSVRGFLSTAGKKQNLKITSIKNDSGDRIYTIGK